MLFRSQFFLSLDDNLLRLFGGPRMQGFFESSMEENSPLSSGLLTRSLNSAQQKVEERAYQQRKNLFDYDRVLSKQREIIYSTRTQILNSQSIEKVIIGYGEQFISQLLRDMQKSNLSLDETALILEEYFGKSFIINSNDPISLQQYLLSEFWLAYQRQRNELRIYGDKLTNATERTICLVNIDKVWREHLQEMPLLREAVSWRSYGQQNPLTEYKKDAFTFFKIGRAHV